MSLFDGVDGRETELIKSNRLNVFIRIKPHLSNSPTSNINILPNGTDLQVNRTDIYSFNAVISPLSDQKPFFKDYIKQKIDDFVHGENQYIFTYGTSSSGKTFTLFGDEKHHGIVPRSLWLVFDSFKPTFDSVVKPYFLNDVVVLKDPEQGVITNLRDSLLSDKSLVNEKDLECDLINSSPDLDKFQYSIWISCAEIYNEKVFDSFEAFEKNLKRQPKEIRTDPSGSAYIKDLIWVPVKNLSETLQLINVAKQRQHIAATKLNQQSSRSHSIFTIKVIRRSKLDEKLAKNLKSVRVSSLVFCDMAGSERCSKAQTLDNAERFKESASINSSLMTFGRCIQIMRSNNKANFEKQTLVPYRDSKLTRIFQSFFNGQGKATMIATVSQDVRLFDETLRTIKFAAVAREITVESSSLCSDTAKVFGVEEEEEKRQRVKEKRMISKSKKAIMRKSMRLVCVDNSVMSESLMKACDSPETSDFDSNYATSDDGSMGYSECPRTPDSNNRLFATLPTLEKDVLIKVVMKLYDDICDEKIVNQKKVMQMERDHFMELDQIHLEYNKKITQLHREYREEIDYEITKRKRLQEAISINNSCALDDSDISLMEILDKTKKKKCSLCHKIRNKLSLLDKDQRMSIFPSSIDSSSEFERIEESIQNIKLENSLTRPSGNEPDQSLINETRIVKDHNISFIPAEKEENNKCSTPTTVIRNPKFREEPNTLMPVRNTSKNFVETSPTKQTTSANNNPEVDVLEKENKLLAESIINLRRQLEEQNLKLTRPKTSDMAIQTDFPCQEITKTETPKELIKNSPVKQETSTKKRNRKKTAEVKEPETEQEDENDVSSDKENKEEEVKSRPTRKTRRINLSLKSEPEQPKRRQMPRRRKATMQ